MVNYVCDVGLLEMEAHQLQARREFQATIHVGHMDLHVLISHLMENKEGHAGL